MKNISTETILIETEIGRHKAPILRIMGRRQIFDHGDTVIYKKYSIYLSIQTTKI